MSEVVIYQNENNVNVDNLKRSKIKDDTDYMNDSERPMADLSFLGIKEKVFITNYAIGIIGGGEIKEITVNYEDSKSQKKKTAEIKVDNSILTCETEEKESEMPVLSRKLTLKIAEIRLNTKNKPKVLVAPYKYQPSHGEAIPKYISLGHELIHALAFFKGLSSERKPVTYYYCDEYGNLVADNSPKNELETVGIFGSQLGITENSIRREHGLDIRVRYSGKI